jgi:hypothetical protein
MLQNINCKIFIPKIKLESQNTPGSAAKSAKIIGSQVWKEVSSSSFGEVFMFFHFSECAPYRLTALRIEAFRRIMLLNDDRGSPKCFAVSFRDTVGFFSTS